MRIDFASTDFPASGGLLVMIAPGGKGVFGVECAIRPRGCVACEMPCDNLNNCPGLQEGIREHCAWLDCFHLLA